MLPPEQLAIDLMVLDEVQAHLEDKRTRVETMQPVAIVLDLTL